MSADAPRTDPAGDPKLRRLDERLGLAISRAGSSPRTLVTYARDHVSVRTPSRPDFRDGNTIDLESPPVPGDLTAWVDRFGETTGRLGVRHVQLRWETPLRPDAPAEVPATDPELSRACAHLGMQLHATTVLLLGEPVAPPEAPAELVTVTPPSSVPRPRGAGVEVRADDTPVEVERRWHAISVLDRYATGETPDDWRASDPEFTAWAVDVQRELAAAGRATIWLALRHGGPVAKAVLLHDRQGLATIEDVVVHPVHRRIGIASALTHRAVAAHLAAEPGSRIGLGADPAGPADHLYRRLGFRPHATVWTALRLPASR
ncbi:MAG: GNAT family N-acetyltransferase [Nitriliruptor sp.]|uniref:GNAT family N-acetyltransferase n=1 Tax=Nitriliruptor sp. TaxID=2448056 RepID=UPI0034A088C3